MVEKQRLGNLLPLLGDGGDEVWCLPNFGFFFLMIGCWNIRGLNDPLTQSEIRRFLKEHHLTFVGILETRVKEHNSILVEKKLANGWHWVTNYTKLPNGRIWIGWDPECWTVGVIGESDQCIHCKVTNLAEKWDGCISVAYGLNC